MEEDFGLWKFSRSLKRAQAAEPALFRNRRRSRNRLAGSENHWLLVWNKKSCSAKGEMLERRVDVIDGGGMVYFEYETSDAAV